MVEQADAVAKASLPVLRDQLQRLIGDVDLLAIGDSAQMRGDFVLANCSEIETLHPAENRCRQPVGVSSR